MTKTAGLSGTKVKLAVAVCDSSGQVLAPGANEPQPGSGVFKDEDETLQAIPDWPLFQ